MPSARARMGALRRKIGKRQKTAGVASGIFSTLGTVAAFGAGQAKKADTAWGEYEAGYEALGGEEFERPKFGQKGYFKGPKGDVRIGDKMYGMENIRKAGSFLGSDDAAILSPEQRQQYLGRTAPGRLAPGLGSAPSTQPHMVAPSSPLSGKMDYKRGLDKYDYSGYQKMFEGSKNILGREEYNKMNAANLGEVYGASDFSQYTPTKVAPGPQIPEMNKPLYGMSSEEVGTRKTQESARDVRRSNVNKFKNQSLEGYDAMNQYRMPSYARGGDFITNGPQKIIVGDNPGGRERVTIRPLPSRNDEEYEKRSLLESLYENNRRRKIY